MSPIRTEALEARTAAAGMSGALRVLAGPAGPGPEPLEAHLHRLGDLPVLGSHLIEVTARARLRGRGGAGFPTSKKLAAVAAAASWGRSPVVIGNGSESEPLSSKDELLLRRRPHLVLDGLELAARAVASSEIYLVVSQSYPEALRAVRQALKERSRERLGDPVRLLSGRPGFVSGEETALISRIEGRGGRPRARPPLVVERGLGGHPTLVQNVETLAQLALLARFGPEWYAEAGTPDEPGTTLVTLAGAVARPGVFETAFGTPLKALLDAGGADTSSRALLVGGYFGGWLSTGALGGRGYSRSELAELDVSPGAGVLMVLSGSACGLRAGATAVRWLAQQSSRQCGPCTFGLPAIANALLQLSEPGRTDDDALERVRRWCSDVEGRGACHHPDGAVRLARSTLRVFSEELGRHRDGSCVAEAAPDPGMATARSAP